MEATVIIQENPSIPQSMCIADDPTGKFSAASGIPVCGVSNTASGGSVATGQSSVRETTQEVPIDLKSSDLILQSKRLAIEAELANLKVTATESARLDAQQQQVKRLIEGQKFSSDNLKANMEKNHALQRDMQNRVQQSFIKQQQFTANGIASRNQSTAAFNAGFAKTKASVQATGDLINASKAAGQARKKAEQQRQEYERLMQDMAREKVEYDRQLAELRCQEEEYKRQLDDHYAKHPFAAAVRKLEEAHESIANAEHHKLDAESHILDKEKFINSLNEQLNYLKSTPIVIRNKIGFGLLYFKASEQKDKNISQIEGQINHATNELNHLRTHLDHCHTQLHQSNCIKKEAEAHLTHLRDEQNREHEAERQHLVAKEVELNKQLNEINKAKAEAKLSNSLIAAHSASINENIPLLTNKINFLSTTQQALNKNEIAACDTLTCKVGVKVMQVAEQVGHDAAYKAGQAVGFGASVLDTGLSVLNLVTHPIDTTVKAYQFAVSDNKLEQIDNALGAKLEHNQSEQDKGTLAGAFNAGLGGGKLTTDVATVAVGVPSAIKSAITGSQKIAALVGPAHNIPVAGTTLNIPGRVLGEYCAIKPGPLCTKQVETFAGGRYSEILLKENVKLYRAGTSEIQFGQYFSLDKPMGMAQVRIDKALLPEWPNGAKSPIDTVYTMEVPAGSKVYVGEVGTQSGFYVGGTHQVVIPSSWDLQGIKILESEPLK